MAHEMNIELADGVSVEDLRGKPFTLICEIAAGEDGRPYLRSRHAYAVTKINRSGQGPLFRLERVEEL